jgi:hypothetical protein
MDHCQFVDGTFVTSRIDATSFISSDALSSSEVLPSGSVRVGDEENGVCAVEGTRTWLQIFAASDSFAANNWILIFRDVVAPVERFAVRGFFMSA